MPDGASATPQKLTHVDEQGRARMVDVGHKPATAREAVAEGVVILRPDTLRASAERSVAKGGVFAAARIAVTVAALSVYDMCKAIDKTMSIEGVRLVSKTGGKSGAGEVP